MATFTLEVETDVSRFQRLYRENHRFLDYTRNLGDLSSRVSDADDICDLIYNLRIPSSGSIFSPSVPPSSKDFLSVSFIPTFS